MFGLSIWDIFGVGSIDWLFWGWVIITIAMFIDLLVPDPIPFIDEAILIILFFLGLAALAIRGAIRGIGSLYDAAMHPAFLAFAATMALLVIYGKFSKQFEKKTRRRK